MVDIKGRLIRYSENCVIADEFDLKKVLNLKIDYTISYDSMTITLPYMLYVRVQSLL